LSTVILERVLDIFTLVLFLVATIWRGTNLPFPHIRRIAVLMLAAASIGLLVLLLGAKTLEPPLRRLLAKLPQSPKVKKIEESLFLALDAIRKIGVVGTLLLLAESIVIWSCEGMIFVSCAKLLGIHAHYIAPWQALVLSNLSYMLPSTPGAIGTFEYFAKIAMTTHHISDTLAALYAVLVHVVILSVITAIGGIFFLTHRYHMSTRKPLVQEIETLPEGMS
ncbi:MAG: lysylphosphatidylglycerol synthase transmembrane domain-containing protein, partial [Acidobacteriaceae bacterium]